jgi:DNA repair protein RecO (recombination protein O)
MPTFRALIWRRIDFRETSRLVTVLTRERGKMVCLAKGAHRPTSPLLGQLDFLNLCEVTLAGRGMPILGKARLLHEPRSLREPTRYLLACYLAGLFDRPLLDQRADPELFDLVCGSLTLVEHSRESALPAVVAGIELRFLAVLGSLPGLATCVQCGGGLSGSVFVHLLHAGFHCGRHRPRESRPAPRAVVERLAEIERLPGRDWPRLTPSRHDAGALDVLGPWIAAAIDGEPRGRATALRRLGRGDTGRSQAS